MSGTSHCKFCLWCGSVLVLLSALPVSAFPQYGAGYGSNLSAVESQIHSHLHSVEKTMESTHKELSESRKQLNRAETEFHKATHEYATVKQLTQKEYNAKPELADARQQLADAETAFHTAREHVLKNLTATKDYQAAADRKQSLTEQLKALASSDSKEARATLAITIADTNTTLSTLEGSAIDADKEAKKARERLQQAEQHLAKLVHERDAAIAKDPKFSSAKIAGDRARDERNAAQKQFSQTQATATQAERAYQALSQQSLIVANQRSQQRRANSGWGYGIGYGYGRGRGRSLQHLGPGSLGGALRIIPPPNIQTQSSRP